MARPKTQESEPETVTVNITDFKRSRDAVSLLFLWGNSFYSRCWFFTTVCLVCNLARWVSHALWK